jgi:predicted nucleic acid-binding protein
LQRLVFDTAVYIDWLNAGLHEDLLFRSGGVKHLSAVVLMELRAGAFSARDRHLLSSLERAFQRAGRVVAPPTAAYAQAGDILRLLQSRYGYQLRSTPSIANDVLIALSARSIGATVVTRNARDYRAIRAIRPFRLEIAPAPAA